MEKEEIKQMHFITHLSLINTFDMKLSKVINIITLTKTL